MATSVGSVATQVAKRGLPSIRDSSPKETPGPMTANCFSLPSEPRLSTAGGKALHPCAKPGNLGPAQILKQGNVVDDPTGQSAKISSS
jgi:hypothetical protein